MTTTDICFEEVNRNKSSAGRHTRYWKSILRYRRSNHEDGRGANPNIVPTPIEYQPYVEDQGEESIAELIRNHPTDIQAVFMYNDRDLDIILDAAADAGTSVSVNYPTKAFDLLHSRDVINRDELIEAVNTIADVEGWAAKTLVQDTKLDYLDL